ncbi:MAG TPA: sigma-70 family RNA polymerase sigma factor [Vicinamibacteria bacterium]|nr:sigma-70 family RNA polymerase sigma factor [Vicinamibacteria bacterium]
MTDSSDRELVDRVLSFGDESAFRELYRRHSPVLFRLAVRLLGGSDADAGDVLQEAWCRAFESLRRFRGASSLRTWLGGVVVNCSREHIRARAQSRNLLSAGLAHPTVGPGREAAMDIRRALDALPEGFREVLVLHAVGGYTHEEIALVLDIAPGTSKSQLSRARRALRSELAATQSEEQA